ncbi:MAG: Methyltransferase type 11 [Frankiales bacterium]|jgi:2-polyprenyl-3-methyl-5-hydroxy-6-metoxy-1,4-benzoquinol methylase|nr:Methyltransferase type 11 [Frankiales bacterium]
MMTAARRDKLREVWDGRATEWSNTVQTTPGFAQVRDRILALAGPQTLDRCLDLGAGTGFLTLPLAEQTASVLAVDLSEAMLETLARDAATAQLPVTVQVSDMAQLDLLSRSFDLIVSNYAFHYMADADKEALLRRMRGWLVPGGRLVLSDMMIGRKLDPHHRRVLAEKALTMLRRGPAGWWRLVKNVARIGSGRGRLRPQAPDWWLAAVTAAGFTAVAYEHVVSEAGIISARVPAAA